MGGQLYIGLQGSKQRLIIYSCLYTEVQAACISMEVASWKGPLKYIQFGNTEY